MHSYALGRAVREQDLPEPHCGADLMVRHQRSTDFRGLVMTIASLKSGQNAMATREVLASKDIRALIAHHLIRQIKTVPLHVGCGTKRKFAG